MPRTVRVYDEYAFGFTWVLEEGMQRSSHALVVDGRVWLVDPVAFDEALERAAGLGEIAGVLQLLDRHNRACAAFAERLDVPHYRVPFEAVRCIADTIEIDVEADALDSMRFERWLATHIINRIPGGSGERK